VVDGRHAGLLSGALLVAYINRRRRIIADEYNRQARDEPSFGQTLRIECDLVANRRCQSLAIEDCCTHYASLPPPALLELPELDEPDPDEPEPDPDEPEPDPDEPEPEPDEPEPESELEPDEPESDDLLDSDEDEPASDDAESDVPVLFFVEE
jgi:hypothetical protein